MNSFTYWTGRMCAVAGLPICANPFVTAADQPAAAMSTRATAAALVSPGFLSRSRAPAASGVRVTLPARLARARRLRSAAVRASGLRGRGMVSAFPACGEKPGRSPAMGLGGKSHHDWRCEVLQGAACVVGKAESSDIRLIVAARVSRAHEVGIGIFCRADEGEKGGAHFAARASNLEVSHFKDAWDVNDFVHGSVPCLRSLIAAGDQYVSRHDNGRNHKKHRDTKIVWADGHADWHSERLGLRVPKLEPEVMERAG